MCKIHKKKKKKKKKLIKINSTEKYYLNKLSRKGGKHFTNVVLIDASNDAMGGGLEGDSIITFVLTTERGMGSIKIQT